MSRKLSRVIVLAVFALIGVEQAYSGPLVVGEQVEVGNAAGNAFTPTPVSGDSNGLYTNVSFQLNNRGGVNASAGLFILDYQQSGSAWEQFASFCLEPDVYLMPFSNPYTVNELSSAGYSQSLIGELWGRYRGEVTNDVNAAAFQVALWELAYGNTDRNLMAGDFRLTSNGTVYDTAQNWLTNLDGKGPMAQGLVVLVNNQRLTDRQDLITQVHSVPEPATLGLLGMGLAGIALARRRKLQPVQA